MLPGYALHMGESQHEWSASQQSEREVRRPSDRIEQARRLATHELLERFSIPALRHAERAFDNVEDAADVIGDAFVAAWQIIDDGGSVNLAWMLRFVDNKKRDRERRDRTRESVMPLLVSEALRAAVAPDADLRIELERVLTGLSMEERHLIELLDLDRYAAGEVAAMLGIRQSTVRKRHQRAREKLRELLTAAEVGFQAGDDHVA